jgi:phage shock protein PspC (stress-responsive transcriptional regulator)
LEGPPLSTLSSVPPLISNQAPFSVKGNILDFRVQSNSGTISGDDGRRYSFVGTDWKDAHLPVRGTRVDFEVRDGNAVSIYVAGFSPSRGSSIATGPSEYSGYYTSSDESTIGGVCAGLAHKWGMNKGGLQVAFILLAFFWFFGLIVYIICWIAFKRLPTKGVKFVA